MSIFVERVVRAPLESLWAHTQDPALHQRWDLRFTEIVYSPRADEADPQGFRYTTRLAFGMTVSGDGETVGERDLADGSHTSALRFGSGQARSLIREGRGYWKYIPAPDGIRFLTSYDYTTRYGVFGAVIDRIAFRPLLGWATAWSFDRLGLWLEAGIDPASSMRQAVAHAVSRLGLAAIFLYHGIVPKVLGPHPDELAMLGSAGVPASLTTTAVVGFGIAEIVLAIALIWAWHRAWPALVGLSFAIVSTIVVAATSPGFVAAPFNPVTLNLAVACLAIVVLVTVRDLPDAGHCARRPALEPR